MPRKQTARWKKNGFFFSAKHPPHSFSIFLVAHSLQTEGTHRFSCMYLSVFQGIASVALVALGFFSRFAAKNSCNVGQGNDEGIAERKNSEFISVHTFRRLESATNCLVV